MYRFALIGQTSSGKTCYMATLALNIPHPDGLTAQLKRDLTESPWPPVAVPEGSAASDSFVDDSVAERKGVEWITRATQALARGLLPPPNDPDRYLIDFIVGSEERGMTQIRMVDYAGESINQDLESNEQRIALFRHLKQCNGLLVVAEVLPENVVAAEQRVIADRIRKVADFFGSLHETSKAHLDTAIAVVLTKWDQHSTIDFDRPDEENVKVREYLRTSPVHRGLVDRVRNFLVEQVEVAVDLPLGIQFGNCAVFPASAFGRCRRDPEGGCQPNLDDQQPFGLVEPLLWLASRFEEISTAEIEANWHSARFARLWPPGATRVKQRCSELLGSVPKKSAVARRLRTVKRSAGLVAVVALVSWVALLVGGVDTARYAWRRSQWFHNVVILESPEAAVDDLAQARTFFAGCQQEKWPGLLSHVLLPQMHGTKELEEFDERRESVLGGLLAKAVAGGDPASIKRAAKEYVKQLPNGQRAEDCKKHIHEAQVAQSRAALKEFMVSSKTTIDSSDDLAELDRIKSEYQQLRQNVPLGLDELNANAGVFTVKLSQRIATIKQAHREDKLRAEVDSALARSDFTQAAASIASNRVADDFTERLVQTYAEGLPAMLDTRLKALVKDQNFDSAMKAADDAVKSLRKIESAIPTSRPAARKAVLDARPGLREVRRESLDEPYDYYLYKIFREEKTDAQCTAYINRAPVGGMKGVVQDYLKFLEESKAPMKITVTPMIRWGEHGSDFTPNYEVSWKMSANGEEVGLGTMIGAFPFDSEDNLKHNVDIQADGLNQKIEIILELKELDDFTDPDDIGRLEARITPLEMQSHKTFKVNGGILTKPHTVWFTFFKGYRPEPNLGANPWHP